MGGQKYVRSVEVFKQRRARGMVSSRRNRRAGYYSMVEKGVERRILITKKTVELSIGEEKEKC